MVIYKWGSMGPVVENIQIALNDKVKSAAKVLEPDEELEPDGNFGNKTYAMVRAFQTEKKLEVDGIVGPNTLKILKPIDYKKARKLLLPDLTVPQAKNSVDCGYFAGMAVAKFSQFGSVGAQITFTENEVHQARDEFIGRSKPGSLIPADMPSYLKQLGQPSFRHIISNGSGVKKGDSDAFDRKMLEYSNQGRSGVALSLPRWTSSAGHWLALIGTLKIEYTRMYRLYDSSSAIVGILRKNRNSGGKCIAWVTSREMQNLLNNTMVGINGGFTYK